MSEKKCRDLFYTTAGKKGYLIRSVKTKNIFFPRVNCLICGTLSDEYHFHFVPNGAYKHKGVVKHV